MNADQVGQVIDKLAEKAGVAVDKFQPVAEEVVRQVAMRGMVQAIICGAITLVAICAAGVAIKKGSDGRLDTEGCIMLTAATLAVAGCGLIGTIYNLSAWLAPLPRILGL